LSESGTSDYGYGKPTSYAKWVQEEGIPIIRGFYIADLKDVEVAPWKRKGGEGTYINLEGTGGTNDAYVVEIAPGGNLNPEKCLFEELVYVLSGRGATTIWNEGGKKQTFEWQAGSLFSPPLNVWRQHFNGQGDQPVRLLTVTNAPMIMDLFHNTDFIFNNPYVFKDRYAGEEGYFSAEGTLIEQRIWESNFIADVPGFQLQDLRKRGAGGTSISFELANNTMAAHISEFPVGTYKKGHRHGPGAHVTIISGEGYSLVWKNSGDPMTRVDWHAGSMFVPADMQFHQHFNVGPAPARYLALRWGSQKFRAGGPMDTRGVDQSVSTGGNQIEYEEEDPEILRIFESELAKRGVESKMSQFIRKSGGL